MKSRNNYKGSNYSGYRKKKNYQETEYQKKSDQGNIEYVKKN